MKKKTGVTYRIADSELPPPSHSYEFVLAGNGVFLRASQPRACHQLAAHPVPVVNSGSQTHLGFIAVKGLF